MEGKKSELKFIFLVMYVYAISSDTYPGHDVVYTQELFTTLPEIFNFFFSCRRIQRTIRETPLILQTPIDATS